MQGRRGASVAGASKVRRRPARAAGSPLWRGMGWGWGVLRVATQRTLCTPSKTRYCVICMNSTGLTVSFVTLPLSPSQTKVPWCCRPRAHPNPSRKHAQSRPRGQLGLVPGADLEATTSGDVVRESLQRGMRRAAAVQNRWPWLIVRQPLGALRGHLALRSRTTVPRVGGGPVPAL